MTTAALGRTMSVVSSPSLSCTTREHSTRVCRTAANVPLNIDSGAASVALLLSGTLSSVARSRPPSFLPEVAASLRRFVIEPLLMARASVTSFLCIPQSEPLPPKGLADALYIVQVVRQEIKDYNHWCPESHAEKDFVQQPWLLSKKNAHSSTWLMWRRVRGCFHAALCHTRKLQTEPFTHFVRARPDIVFFAPLPLSELDPGAVSLRARSLHGGLSTLHVSRDHLTSNSCSAMMSPKCLRQRSQCLLIDDQFAIVPCHLARSFFEQSINASHTSTVRQLRMFGRPASLVWGGDVECASCLGCFGNCPETRLTAIFMLPNWPEYNRIDHMTGSYHREGMAMPFDVQPFRFRVHPGPVRISQGFLSDANETEADINRPTNCSCT